MRSPPGPDANLSAEPQPNRQTHTQDPRAKRTTPKGSGPVFAVGDMVRAERATSARGSWSRYAGRVGTIVSINISRSVRDDAPDVTEYGVDLTGVGNNVTAFFRPDELAAVDYAEPADGRLDDAVLGRAL